MHSSRQKNFRLCLSTGSPTYAPHNLQYWIQASFSTGLKPVFSTCSRKKSSKLWSGEIVSLCLLLYSKASSIVVHRNSEILATILSSSSFPSQEITDWSPSQSTVVVVVNSAMSVIGFSRVPWIQLGPLSRYQPRLFKREGINWDREREWKQKRKNEAHRSTRWSPIFCWKTCSRVN